jgi:hypothetical protein
MAENMIFRKGLETIVNKKEKGNEIVVNMVICINIPRNK